MNTGAFFAKKLRVLLFAACMVLPLSGCGYQWQGSESAPVSSVLGNGGSTIKITDVEQSSLYPWISYYLRSQLHNEILIRKLAVWQEQGETDYNIKIRMPAFSVSTHISGTSDETLLNSGEVKLEIIVCEGGTESVVWRSGVLSYSEHFENQRENVTIRELLKKAIQRIVDRMQMTF